MVRVGTKDERRMVHDQQSFKTSKNGSLGSLGQFVWIKDTMVHSFACMERIEQEDQCGMVPGTPMVRDKQGSLPWFTCVVRTLGKRFVPNRHYNFTKLGYGTFLGVCFQLSL